VKCLFFNIYVIVTSNINNGKRHFITVAAEEAGWTQVQRHWCVTYGTFHATLLEMDCSTDTGVVGSKRHDISWCNCQCYHYSNIDALQSWCQGTGEVLQPATVVNSVLGSIKGRWYRARQLYKNICMLFLFPVKYGKLSTGVNAQHFLLCYG